LENRNDFQQVASTADNLSRVNETVSNWAERSNFIAQREQFADGDKMLTPPMTPKDVLPAVTPKPTVLPKTNFKQYQDKQQQQQNQTRDRERKTISAPVESNLSMSELDLSREIEELRRRYATLSRPKNNRPGKFFPFQGETAIVETVRV
jgi:hypothetical protein